MVWWFVARAPLLPPVARKTGRITWPDMRERRFWLLVVNFGLGGAALGPTLYLSPLYLNRVMGLSQAQLGKILWIPALIWELGYYFWGWVGDRFVREDPRPIRLYLLLTVLALAPAFLTRVDSWPVVLAFFSWAMFIAVGFIVMSLHLGARAYRRDQTGMVAGVGSGAWSAVVAILLPIYGRWFDHAVVRGDFHFAQRDPDPGDGAVVVDRPGGYDCSTSGFTTLIGLPAQYAAIWSKISEN